MRVVGLALQGVGPYEQKASFKFKPGINVIYGLNRTSGKNSQNSNWVGKSLLFSALSEVLYEEPVVGSKQDRLTTGLQQVLLEDDANNKYLISKKNNKYIIKENGKDKQFVTGKKGPKQFIESIWPISMEEYETFVHIDSRVPHPLVMGSTAMRKEFFTKFFGLDKVDAERKLYLAELNKLAAVRESYNSLKSAYNLLKQDTLDREGLIALNEEKKLAAENVASLEQRMLEMKMRQQLVEFATVIKSDINKLEQLGFTSEDSIKSAYNAAKTTLAKVKQKQADVNAYEEYKIYSSAYNKAYDALTEFEKSCDIEHAKEGARRHRIKQEQVEDLEQKIAEFKAIKAVEKPEHIEGDLYEVKSQLATARNNLKNAKIFGEGTCPTCGQAVEVNIPELESAVARLEEQYKQIQAYSYSLDEYEQYKTAKEKNDENESKLESAKQQAEKYEKYVDVYRHLRALPEKPEPFTGNKYDKDEVDAELEEAKENASFYARIYNYAKKIEDYFNLEDKTIDKDVFTKYTEASTKYQELRTRFEAAKINYEKLVKIDEQLSNMQEQLKDVKPLEYLVELFQDKTLKKRIVQMIGTRLMTLVNKYAAVVFNEDYKFELNWDSSQISILCTRKSGKRLLVSDVRKLSGAESRLFTLILVLSLIAFVPKNKRPNCLILDEPDSALSTETAAAFFKILQQLTNVVESVVVITVRRDAYPGSRCYTVLREGTSRIIEGHPDDL